MRDDREDNILPYRGDDGDCAKQFMPILGTNGDEIRPVLRIVISL
jgi:hypothetical protein